jgi:hypothetical protein
MAMRTAANASAARSQRSEGSAKGSQGRAPNTLQGNAQYIDGKGHPGVVSVCTMSVSQAGLDWTYCTGSRNATSAHGFAHTTVHVHA